MLFCIAGDLHGEISSFYKYLEQWQIRTDTKIDAILQVGDFGIYTRPEYQSDFVYYWRHQRVASIPTWVIAGNHESWEDVANWIFDPNRMENLRLLPDGEITEVMGQKIGVVWGNFSPKSWANPAVISHVRNYSPNSLKALHVYKPNVDHLLGLGEFDILLTHDAPEIALHGLRQPPTGIKRALGLDPEELCYGVKQFHDLWESGKPKYAFHGHMHSYKIYKDTEPLGVQLNCWQYNREASLYFLEV